MAPNCDCGYYDAVANQLYTDSIIVYFNESTSVPTDTWSLQRYQNYAEKSWNAYYRQGADPSNVVVANQTYSDRVTNSSMQLWVNPATPDHLVVGGGIETLRQDIQYGTFRSWMRSPQPYPKGTALSMQLRYNVSQGIQLNMQNTNDPSTAWISNLMADEFAVRSLGVNYTVLSNTSLPNSTANPFDYFELKMDWNQDNITYWAGDNATRFVTSDSPKYFSTPSGFEIKHWSIGDEYQMEGPPLNDRVKADVGWFRAFFNVSTMTDAQHAEFDSTCQISRACSVDDPTLRGSTAFPPAALDRWQPAPTPWSAVWPAVAICAVCLCFTIIFSLNAIFRRFILERGQKPSGHAHAAPSLQGSDDFSDSGTTYSGRADSTNPGSGAETSNGGTLVSPTPAQTRPHSLKDAHMKEFDSAFHKGDAAASKSSVVEIEIKGSSPPGSLKSERIYSPNFLPPMPGEHDFDNGLHIKQNIATGDVLGDDLKKIEAEGVDGKPHEIITEQDQADLNQEKSDAKGEGKGKGKETVSTTEVKPAAAAAAAPAARQRIDYLAGLVALCSLLVTAIHFALTFVPALVFPAGYAHYPSEPWARKIIGPYVFNQVWVGLFFATSTRFLVMKFLKTKDLGNVAEKVVARVPRLFAPIGAVILLEYFLIDCGAITYLQYLPSVTWSTWPYTVEFQNFGIFIDEFLELIYLVPNAVPRIVFNYCIGVLWTIPVQLQGTWTALLGAIVVVQCNSPAKRFFYYAINIVYNWYMLKWGSFFWFGLLLTDLDVIWKYRPWLYARPWIYYPLLTFFAVCGVAGLTNDLVSSWTPINYAAIEWNIHPDLPSGLPLSQTANTTFPFYYSPTIKHILFCLGFQAVVELSANVQKALGNRFFVLIFPHIFTIYLIHGFIFWSIGAASCVAFERIGLPYWANSLLVAVICYGTLAIAVQIITPVIEVLGKDGAANAWRMANKKIPVVRWRPTLTPYPRALFDERADACTEGFGDVIEKARDVQNTPSEVAEIKEHIAKDNIEFVEKAIEEHDVERVEVVAPVGSSKLAKALSKD